MSAIVERHASRRKAFRRRDSRHARRLHAPAPQRVFPALIGFTKAGIPFVGTDPVCIVKK